MSELPRHLWPAKLAEIAEYCGEATALALWARYPGCHIFVPVALTHGHPLIAALGVERAARLCEMYGGETLQIAKAQAARIAARNAVIRARRLAGAGLGTLALEFDLCERQIISICGAAAERDAAQLDLFD